MNPLDSVSGSAAVAADHDWGLVLKGSDWIVRVIGPFEQAADNTTVTIDPEDIAIRSDRVGVPVIAIESDIGGVLILRFADGLIWRVPPSDNYEAWEVATPLGRVICSIGGTVVHWDY